MVYPVDKVLDRNAPACRKVRTVLLRAGWGFEESAVIRSLLSTLDRCSSLYGLPRLRNKLSEDRGGESSQQGHECKVAHIGYNT
jgi:hypothetical protein